MRLDDLDVDTSFLSHLSMGFPLFPNLQKLSLEFWDEVDVEHIDKCRGTITLFLELLTPHLRFLKVSLPTHQSWRELAALIHSTIFASGVCPRHLYIGGQWDDSHLESLAQQHPAFLRDIQTFELA
jgi:hypothetical protein